MYIVRFGEKTYVLTRSSSAELLRQAADLLRSGFRDAAELRLRLALETEDRRLSAPEAHARAALADAAA